MTATSTTSGMPAIPSGPLHLGFLTVLQEGNGHLGGYLVTNVWGRPLEFRLSSAVQPNKVQQILYGPTLHPYICADLIGKTLYEKSTVQPQIVVSDSSLVLDLRRKVSSIVLWMGPESPEEEKLPGLVVSETTSSLGLLCSHADYPEDVALAKELLQQLDRSLDLTEPFTRIREAISEARRMGITSRAA